MSIDSAGDVIGSYTDSNQVRHGFIRSASGTITTFDAPEAETSGASGTIGGTLPTSIDPTGSTITGMYSDANGLGHGFIYYLPLTGKSSFTSFTPPNMTTSTALPIQGAVLNANASGTVAGFYLDNNQAAHGFEYTSTPTPTPTFNPPQGTYSSAQSVTISDTDSSATIYYTTDGSTPTVNSIQYTQPVSIASTSTLSAVALDTTVGGYIQSAVASATYTISGTTGVTDTPAFSPGAGTYATARTVTIADNTPGATIYYTTDGTTPTTSSAVYSSPITVSSSETLQAIATASGYSQTAVGAATYTINLLSITATPTFTPPGGTFSTAQSVTISDSTPGATIYFTTNGSTPTTSSALYSSPIAVTSSETIKAIATANGYSASSVGSSAYTIITSAQSEWTWMGGNNAVNQPGVYGTLGVSAAANFPGARQIAASWTDSFGHVWLFGGWGYDASGTLGKLNDLWMFNPSNGQWTWMGGSQTVGANGGQPGVYGTLGTPATGNIPGGRDSTSSWIDGSGNLWLFGGSGYDANGNLSTLNDLWTFNPSTDEWAWMGGSNTAGQPGVYGAMGTPAAGNVPGSRYGASSWTDSNGDFWLFGGLGVGTGGAAGWLNDLWMFNPATKQWVWMGGSDTTYQSGHYGSLGTPAAGNFPGSRKFATSWTDSSGNFWLFGGYGDDANGAQGWLNDLWKFSPATNQWAWIGGSSSVGSNGGQPGVYGTLGAPASTNIPGGRQIGARWTDKSGNLWLFGGTGLDGAGNYGILNDLWEFNPASNTWAWLGGSSTAGSNGGQPGVYGSLGIPAPGNIPGGRGSAASWIDSSGNFWLFDGNGFGTSGNQGDLNDLWEYQPLGAAAPQVATPTFSPSAGTYSTAQSVTISDSTPGATIYYTTNGTTPTTASAVYAGPIIVSSSETLEAIGNASGYSPSSAASAAYTISSQAGQSTTTYTYKGNDYGTVIGVTCGGTYCTGGPYALTVTFTTTLTGGALDNLPLTDITSTVTSYKLTDGSGLVDDNSASYYHSFQIATDASGNILSWLIETCGTTCNIQMQTNWNTYYSFHPGADFSETLANFAGNFGFVSGDPGTWTQTAGSPSQPAAVPTFSPSPGAYTSTQTVTIADATPEATIYYTTDGSTPTTSSLVYTNPIAVSSSQTIKAIAAASGYLNSAVAVAQYTVNLPAPDFQLSVNPSSLSIARGQSGTAVFTVTPANGFNSAVSFSCSGLPAEATCTFNPSTVTPNGSPVTSTLTVKTTAATTAFRLPQRSSRRLVYAGLFPLFAMLFGFVLFRGRRRLGAPFWGMFILLLVSAGLTSCGGGGGAASSGGGDSGTPLGTSTVSVSASAAGSGVTNHAASLTITITQ